MSRRLRPLAARRGYHRYSRAQRRRLLALQEEMAFYTACAKMWIARGDDVPMVVEYTLTDFPAKVGRTLREARGCGGRLHVGADVFRVLVHFEVTSPASVQVTATLDKQEVTP